MLLGAVAEVPPAPGAAGRAISGSAKGFESTALAQPDLRPGGITASQDQAGALSTTTPSVAPPAPANPGKLPSDMATVASAVSPPIDPGPAAVLGTSPHQVQPDWGIQVAAGTADSLALARDIPTASPDSRARVPRHKAPSLALLLVLGILTLGVYPLVIWLASRRQAKPRLGID